jgi:GxxExxY protein
MSNVILEEESYSIIGKCMEVHRTLGPGFLEIVYKDALEFEFSQAGIPFERERRYDVHYKGIILPHYFCADFVIFDQVILEVKCAGGIANEFIAQALNYLKVSGHSLALIVNFGEIKLKYKRVVL